MTNTTNVSKQPIVQLGHPSLRSTSQDIPPATVNSADVQSLIADLLDTLHSQSDGVGLSAPQIGINKRIFVLSGKVLELDEDIVCINPVITKSSRRKQWMEEGCLSIRGQYGEVQRHKTITFSYIDQHGQQQTRGAGHLFSQAVQHEIDHLDGVLFIDKARDLHSLSPEELDALLADNM